MGEERIQRRLAAIMAADVVGYSRQMELDETGAMERLRSLRTELFDPSTKRNRGRIFKNTGDGALVEFASAVDAVLCAVEIQQSQAERNEQLPEEGRILLRIGISLGDVIVEGDDLFGHGVNVAARMESIAEPGSICVSGNVFEHIGTLPDLMFEDIGEQSVKNISRPIRTYRVRPAGVIPANPNSLASAPLSEQASGHAIAVLPLSTLSADIEQQYLADGVAIDIIEALTAWRGFPVVGWDAVIKYRGAMDQARIAEELGVRYIVSGSLRMTGERMRVSMQLTEAETWYVVWSQTYERSARDVFEVQDEIAKRVAATVAPQLEWIEGRKSLKKQRSELQFWEYFHRGNAHLLEFTEQGNQAARDVFRAALKLDRSSGKAWTGLAYSLDRDLFWGFSKDRSRHIHEMLDATTHAVIADPSHNLGRIMHCYAALWEGDFKLAVASAREAFSLNPSDGFSHIILGEALDMVGEREEAVERARAGVALNENHPRIHTFRGVLLRIYLSARNYAAAEEWGMNALHERSDYPHLHAYIAAALVYQGRKNEAIELIQRVPLVPVGIGQLYQDPNDNGHIANALEDIGWFIDDKNPGIWSRKL